MLSPQNNELFIQEAAYFLNVSRPFVIKQIELGLLRFTNVGRHRHIVFEDLLRFKALMHQQSEAALKDLASLTYELGLEY